MTTFFKIKPSFAMAKIVPFIVLLYVIGCTHQSSPDNNSSAFYTLDFENDNVSQAELNRYFLTTFPHSDPTEGNVVYDRVKWVNEDMVKVKDSDGLYLYIRQSDQSGFFDSVRVTSKHMYNIEQGNEAILFVFKGALPSVNGAWPAWWLNGSYEKEWLESTSKSNDDLDQYSGVGNYYDTPSAVNSTDWPSAGEVDIIESINGQKLIHNTLHTCPQMYDSVWNNDPKIINCANAKIGDPNAGCSGNAYEVEETQGTFAAIWKKTGIEFYYWPEGEEVRKPGGPLSSSPNPTKWLSENLKNTVSLLPTTAACQENAHESWQCKNCQGSENKKLANLKMIFNITTCGKWAGAKFDDSDTPLANCQAYISGDGKSAIDGKYIKVEYLSVKQLSL